jgi:hypothetical protein
MSYPTTSVAVSWSVAHRPLGSASSGRVRAGPRRSLKRAWLVEPLEGRVVPATITVTSLADAGAGTLRAAIAQANLDAAQDTITFAPSVTGTISLSTALPDLSTNIVIDGPGPSALSVARSGADGTPAFRIFTVPVGVEVSISGLSITGGREISGGGISNSGMLSLTDCTLGGNSATLPGGGIFSSGTLTLIDCTLSGNSATGSGGFLGPGSGGGIFSSGALTLIDCTLSDNSAGGGLGGGASGGGVSNYGIISLNDITIIIN